MVLIVSIPKIQDYPFTHGIFRLILTEKNNGLAVRGEKLVKKKLSMNVHVKLQIKHNTLFDSEIFKWSSVMLVLAL